jgi:hypothetical protein
MRVISTLILFASLLPLTDVVGEEIYRTVDEEGNVTYTDSPPAGDRSVERVELPPAPPQGRAQQSGQRNQGLLDAAKQAEQKRQHKKKMQEASIKAAKEKLAAAEARLVEAKEIRDEDRQHLVGGKRRIHPDYFERVKQAETEVEQARKALREARGY